MNKQYRLTLSCYRQCWVSVVIIPQLGRLQSKHHCNLIFRVALTSSISLETLGTRLGFLGWDWLLANSGKSLITRKNSQWMTACGLGGDTKKNSTLRLLLEVQPLTPLYTIFSRKDTPFVYLPLTNGTPFVYPPNRNSSCHFHAAFNKFKQYSNKVWLFEIY